MKINSRLLTGVLILCAAVFSSSAVRGAVIAIDTARWYNTLTGQTQRAMGGGGTPILNCQDDNGQWSIIRDDWSQVGNKQIWRSVNGKEAVFCDSVGNYHVRRGTHHLGLHSVRLIRFNRLDSTYQVLDGTPAPDSVTAVGGSVFCWGIFYGINLEIRNNAKVFQESALRWEFTQAARDSLANVPGTWANRLIATVHQIDYDSLNATLPGLTAKGVLTNAHIDIREGGRRIWALSKSFIETADSLTQIPVWKRVVLTGGNAFFIEAFSPQQTAALPSGSLWHDVLIGNTTGGGNLQGLEDKQAGGRYAAPAQSGITDSVTAYVYVTTANHNMTPNVYNSLAEPTLVQCGTAEVVTSGSIKWNSWVCSGGAITGGNRYAIGVWAEATTGDAQLGIYSTGATTADTIWYDTETYSAGNCVSTTSGTLNYNTWRAGIYCTYTESGAATTIKGRRREIFMPTRGANIKESQKTFAGETNVLDK